MPEPTNKPHATTDMTRRTFIKAAAVTTGALAMTQPLWSQVAAGTDTIKIGMVGVGRQGKILLNYILQIPNVRVEAVCDIWSYSQRLGGGLVKRSNNPDVRVYSEYDEMLAAEKDLDAVVIATPDFLHEPMTNKALAAGLHVYCEKEMSNTLAAAASMVTAQRASGKLLQIGHQRRSNPYYQHAHRLLHKDKFCGDVTVVNGQWNQLKPLRPLPAKMIQRYSIPQDVLEKHGYGSMAEFYDWRWFNKFAGGPMTDLGSHQVDIFTWFLGAPPKSVMAFGNANHAVAEAKANNVGFVPECFDHTLAYYEFDSPTFGSVSAFYQVVLTSSNGGFYEVFMGDTGSIRISEIREKSLMLKEKVADALAWEDQAEQVTQGGDTGYQFDPLKSRKQKGQTAAANPEVAEMEEKLEKAKTKVHLLHLENFFAAIRGDEKLTCPADVGYETAVCVLKANESAHTGKKIELSHDDFKVA